MPILGQKYRHIDMSGLLIGHNRTAKVRIYLLIIKCFRKKVEKDFGELWRDGIYMKREAEGWIIIII